MKTLSPHFFMEVLVKKLHSTVDKFATLNHAGDVIWYTTKVQPKLKCSIDLAEGQRIFEDLYGSIATRWERSPEFIALQARKNKAAARRTHKGRA